MKLAWSSLEIPSSVSNWRMHFLPYVNVSLFFLYCLVVVGGGEVASRTQMETLYPSIQIEHSEVPDYNKHHLCPSFVILGDMDLLPIQ